MDERGEATDLLDKRVGERLADARRAQKLDVGDIAARTRIPQRHIEALEEGRYGDLPASTYAVGFAKSYARALGLDETGYARDLRAELDQHGGRAPQAQYFEPADPARVPPRWLVWTAAAVVLAVIAAYLLLRPSASDELDGREPSEVAAAIEPERPASAPVQRPAAPPPAPAGDVVLTATETVWVRIYDADNDTLLLKEMAQGERFAVPADAKEPKIRTARAQALQVTVGGRPVPPLGPPDTTIRDVGVSAAALAARAPAGAPSS